MSSSLRRAVWAAAAATAGTVALTGGPASAQVDPCYPPTPACTSTSSSTSFPAPTLSLSDTTVVRGQTITATVGNFQAGSSGIITIASVEQQIGSFTAGAAGTASTSITIPTGIELGAHTVFARGTALNGAPGTAAQGITVVAGNGDIGDDGNGSGGSGSGANLARTGAVVIPTALVGMGLVAGGVVLKRSSRRGKSTKTA